MRKSKSGVPWLEIAITAVVVGVVGAIFADRLLYYRELADKATFELMLTNMRSGLRFELARRIVTGKQVSDIAGSNPVRFLEDVPEGYSGVRRARMSTGELDALAAGTWIFVTDEATLYYKPILHRYLVSDRVIPVIPVRIGKLSGAEVAILADYQWF